MKVICNSIGACSHCIRCGAARVHDKIGCEPCLVVKSAQCIEVVRLSNLDETAFFALITALKFLQAILPKIHHEYLEYFQNREATQQKGLYRVEYKMEAREVEVNIYTIKP